MGREPTRFVRKAGASLVAWLAAASLHGEGERAYTVEDNSYTVEPGRFAVEITPLTLARHHAHGPGDVEVESWSFGYSVVRIGIARDTEAGVAFESWQVAHARDPETDAHAHVNGSGNLALRLKQNLFGNDGGRVSLALTPYVRLPTGSQMIATQRSEWGLAVPVDFVLSEKWAALVVTYGDWLGDSDDSGRHFESSVLVDFSRTFATDWSVLFECYYQLTPESGAAPVGTVNVGVGRTWSSDFYTEVGTMFGITHTADDLAAYVSLGRRF